MMKRHRGQLALTAIFFTFFMDMLSWSIVFPIFAPYFLDVSNHLFTDSTSLAARTTWLGMAIALFSLGQFLGSPLLGAYADRRGRKKALSISIFGTFCMLALSALSVRWNMLLILLMSRFATGLFAGNLSVCLASVGDLVEEESERAKQFGKLSLAAGLAFVVGAFSAGKLAVFTLDFPLWIASILCFINWCYVALFFQETRQKELTFKFSFLGSFRELKDAFYAYHPKKIYMVFFLFLLSWTLLMQFMPVFMVHKYFFTNSSIADLAVYMGICWAVGASLSKLLLCVTSPRSSLELGLICFTLFSLTILLPRHLWEVLLVFGLSVASGGLSWPLCTHLLSQSASKHSQGKILGLSQSVQSLAFSIAPLLGGLAYHISFSLVFWLAGGFSLLASLLYFFVLKK